MSNDQLDLAIVRQLNFYFVCAAAMFRALASLFVCVAAAAAVSYEGYHALVAGPLKTRQQLELVDLLRDEDTRTRKVRIRALDHSLCALKAGFYILHV